MATQKHDTSKLPRWAQNEIQRLTANLEWAERRLNAGPDNSDTFADPYSENAVRPLGKGTVIQFGTDLGQRLRAHYERGLLVVSADEVLTILPRASNSIEMASERRR